MAAEETAYVTQLYEVIAEHLGLNVKAVADFAQNQQMQRIFDRSRITQFDPKPSSWRFYNRHSRERPLPQRSGRQEMTDVGSSEDSTWSVLILNDDYTPMEFVVDAIEQFFDMDRESAMHLMLRIHNEGIAECGAYSHEIAAAKATQVVAFAREHQHPLQCVIERKR
ncbi:MAG TPA: ATP-dependent Clp protease adapter ClpS [Terriglobales bacterium]|nr:ATP-dependent Clp protease adapter ClpS [Terriglobales bacterium]